MIVQDGSFNMIIYTRVVGNKIGYKYCGYFSYLLIICSDMISYETMIYLNLIFFNLIILIMIFSCVIFL